jgi:hypothetical protein
MPRLRMNQRELSAISGPNTAEEPSRPIGMACAAVNTQRLGAMPAMT